MVTRFSSIDGLAGEILVLENEIVRVEIIPDYGAKISRILDKRTGCELLWENLPDRRPSYGVDYDEFDTGGIEIAFPTGHVCNCGSKEIPFFGEVWSMPWEWKLEEDGSILLERACPVFPASTRMTIALEDNKITTKYGFAAGDIPVEYLAGVHPSLAVYEGSRIELPDSKYRVQSKGETEKRDWPMLEDRDLRICGKASDEDLWHLVIEDLPEGSVKIIHPGKSALEMRFSIDDFHVLNLWLMYGGWRGYNLITTELFTDWPIRLSDAIECGTARKLAPGEAHEYEIAYIVG